MRRTLNDRSVNLLGLRISAQEILLVACPGDLTGKVGTVMRLRVDSAGGTRVHFHIEVSKTPGHITA